MTAHGRLQIIKRLTLAGSLHEVRVIWDGLNPDYQRDDTLVALKDKRKEAMKG